VLATIELPEDQALGAALLSCAGHENIVVQEAATRVLVFRYPKLATSLLDRLTPGVCRGLCYSENPRFIRPLLEYWQFPDTDERFSPALGFLLSPQWLAQYWNEEAREASLLARTFGYASDSLDEPGGKAKATFQQLLAQGLMTVCPELDATCSSLYTRRELDSFAMQWSGVRHVVPASETEVCCSTRQFLSIRDGDLMRNWRDRFDPTGNLLLLSCSAFSEANDAGHFGKTVADVFAPIRVHGMRYVGSLSGFEIADCGKIESITFRQQAAKCPN